MAVIQISADMTETFEKARKMMETSTYTLDGKSYYYCKVATMPASLGKHLLVSKDDMEITVVTSDPSDLDLIEKNENKWALIDFKPSAAYVKGTILLLAEALFNIDSNILVISTYSKDYTLVKEQDLEKVENALVDIGVRRMD